VFKQYFSPLDKQQDPNAKPRKSPYLGTPNVSDWIIAEDGAMRAVSVGQRDPPPEVPECPEWEISGNIPPPAALIVAAFYAFKPIVWKIFGITRAPSASNQTALPDGLSPVW